jgi:hypothetical protein
MRDLKGQTITFESLLNLEGTRWTRNRKYTVVVAVRAGIVSLKEVLSRYSMDREEFDVWADAVDRARTRFQKVTMRPAPRQRRRLRRA